METPANVKYKTPAHTRAACKRYYEKHKQQILEKNRLTSYKYYHDHKDDPDFRKRRSLSETERYKRRNDEYKSMKLEIAELRSQLISLAA